MFSHDVKRARLEYQSFQCAECGKDLWRKPLSQSQAHHIEMHKRGGSTDLSNCVVLCPECHKKVDQMTIEGHIWPGNYTRDDIQPEQKVKPIMNKR